jgi:hypothetical protein
MSAPEDGKIIAPKREGVMEKTVSINHKIMHLLE